MKIKLTRNLFYIGLIVLFAFVLVAITTANAYATGTFSTINTNEKISSPDEGVNKNTETGFAENQTSSANQLAQKQFPSSFSLTNFHGKNCVTPVKFQNPWGTCWAFGIVSAAETSILAESEDMTAEDLDLSERHLSWFCKTHLPAIGEEGYDPQMYGSQSGEGIWFRTPEQYANRMNSGLGYYGTIAFASGQGIASEYVHDKDGNVIAYAPYKNDEGYLYAENDKGESKTFEDDENMSSVQKAISEGYDDYAYYQKSPGTWALNESKRFGVSYKLQESNMLPSVTPIKQEDGSYLPNTAGINAYKQELSAGRGVNIAYRSESWAPGRYINDRNKRYSHFTWERVPITHSVTIIGWDDTYSKDNFKLTNPVRYNSNRDKIYRLKATGEDLETDHSTGKPLDPVTKEPLSKNDYEPSLEYGDIKKTTGDLIVYKQLTNEGSELSYSQDGTTLIDPETSNPVDVKRIMMVSMDDKNQAVRDENDHVKYKKWTPAGHTTEYENDKDGNPIVEGVAITDKFVVECAHEDNIKIPSGDGAWICKNSWGSNDNQIPNKLNWGTDGSGYFYLSYYDLTTCVGETFDFAVSETEKAETDSYLIYQYDYMPTFELEGETESSPNAMANVFPAKHDIWLKHLSSTAYKPNTTIEYDVYKLNKDYKDPTDGELIASAKGTYEFAGYHRAALDKPVFISKDDTFSVVSRQYYIDDNGNKQYSYLYTEEIGENHPSAASGGYSKSVVNPGESYILTNKESNKGWQDWSKVINEKEDVKNKEWSIDNFPIKAYADYAGDQPIPGDDSATSIAATGDATSDILTFVLISIVSAFSVMLATRKCWQFRDLFSSLSRQAH